MQKINVFSFRILPCSKSNKGSEAYNNMLANILPLHTLEAWVGIKKSTIFSFLKVVMLFIKLMGMEKERHDSNIFSAQHFLVPLSY